MDRMQIFALAVKQMRRAQKNYFKIKAVDAAAKAVKYEALKVSIAREQEVDKELAAILTSEPATLTEEYLLKIENDEQAI